MLEKVVMSYFIKLCWRAVGVSRLICFDHCRTSGLTPNARLNNPGYCLSSLRKCFGLTGRTSKLLISAIPSNAAMRYIVVL